MPFSFGMRLSVSIDPVPNLWKAWSGFERCLHSCMLRHTSEFRFLEFSEFTALISRPTPSLEMRGATKNCANLSRASAKSPLLTSKW